jgi:hypothetical protein
MTNTDTTVLITNKKPSRDKTSTTTIEIITSTFPAIPECQNEGVYDPSEAICRCLKYFSGDSCENSIIFYIILLSLYYLYSFKVADCADIPADAAECDFLILYLDRTEIASYW